MIKLLLTRLGVAVGGLALSLTAGAGVASADPDLDPIIHTTCTYPQAIAALNAQNPTAAAIFAQSPETQDFLKTFIAASPDDREAMAQQVQNSPTARPYFGVIAQMFSTCNKY